MLLVGGISSFSLFLCTYICDYLNLGNKLKFAHSFGVNPIFSYVLAGMLTLIFYSDKLWGIGLNKLFMDYFGELGISLKLLSLIYAIIYVMIIWLPTLFLFKRKIYIKL